MKIIITSVDALIDQRTRNYFEGIKEALDHFKAMDEDNDVIVISVNSRKLKPIGKDFETLNIQYRHRQSPTLIKIVEETLGAAHSDVFVLGSKTADVAMAANAKALLLTAAWAESNNPTETIYTTGYGEPISTPEKLISFFDHFLDKMEPWYYHLKVSATTDIYSLTNANTYTVSEEVKKMNDEFSAYLKNGAHKYKDLFRTYFAVSTYYIFKALQNVNYWGVYPSSGTALNQDLEYFKEHARKLYKCRAKEPILIRQTQAEKRHSMSKGQRLQNGCKEQLETIIINPHYRRKLNGATVCIIDDFTTYGTSCETTRHLLEAAGVAKLIFITMGKFGKEYHKFEYDLQPLPNGLYNGLTCKFIGSEQKTGNFNPSANREMLDSLKDLL